MADHDRHLVFIDMNRLSLDSTTASRGLELWKGSLDEVILPRTAFLFNNQYLVIEGPPNTTRYSSRLGDVDSPADRIMALHRFSLGGEYIATQFFTLPDYDGLGFLLDSDSITVAIYNQVLVVSETIFETDSSLKPHAVDAYFDLQSDLSFIITGCPSLAYMQEHPAHLPYYWQDLLGVHTSTHLARITVKPFNQGSKHIWFQDKSRILEWVSTGNDSELFKHQAWNSLPYVRGVTESIGDNRGVWSLSYGDMLNFYKYPTCPRPPHAGPAYRDFPPFYVTADLPFSRANLIMGGTMACLIRDTTDVEEKGDNVTGEALTCCRLEISGRILVEEVQLLTALNESLTRGFEAVEVTPRQVTQESIVFTATSIFGESYVGQYHIDSTSTFAFIPRVPFSLLPDSTTSTRDLKNSNLLE